MLNVLYILLLMTLWQNNCLKTKARGVVCKLRMVFQSLGPSLCVHKPLNEPYSLLLERSLSSCGQTQKKHHMTAFGVSSERWRLQQQGQFSSAWTNCSAKQPLCRETELPFEVNRKTKVKRRLGCKGPTCICSRKPASSPWRSPQSCCQSPSASHHTGTESHTVGRTEQIHE